MPSRSARIAIGSGVLGAIASVVLILSPSTSSRSPTEDSPRAVDGHAAASDAVVDRVKLLALTRGGDHERLMRYLLDKAKPVVEAKKHDPEGIKALVEEALSGEIDARRRAGLELAARNGDYVVAYLLPALGDPDPAKVVNAIFAFHAIGAAAVQPLMRAMSTSDARVRGYVAVVLGDLRDPRALAALQRAAECDEDVVVRDRAARAIAKIESR